VGFAHTRKAQVRGKDKSIEHALRTRRKAAQYIRFGAIGDPGSIAPDVYLKHDALARAEGLGVLSYTHQWHWKHAQHLKGYALASCDDMRDVRDAVKRGWRTALHVGLGDTFFNGKTIVQAPRGTLDGMRYTLCPAQRQEYLGTRNEIVCNNCGLCDGQANHQIDIIVFIRHGQMMRFWERRTSTEGTDNGM
jgi:hypothetical protein